jgi:hypothetical protein
VDCQLEAKALEGERGRPSRAGGGGARRKVRHKHKHKHTDRLRLRCRRRLRCKAGSGRDDGCIRARPASTIISIRGRLSPWGNRHSCHAPAAPQSNLHTS